MFWIIYQWNIVIVDDYCRWTKIVSFALLTAGRFVDVHKRTILRTMAKTVGWRILSGLLYANCDILSVNVFMPKKWRFKWLWQVVYVVVLFLNSGLIFLIDDKDSPGKYFPAYYVEHDRMMSFTCNMIHYNFYTKKHKLLYP